MLSCVWNLRVFPEMHDGDSAPSCCAFTHWVAFEEVSGLRGTLGSSLRSLAEGEGNEGFPPPPDKDLEWFFFRMPSRVAFIVLLGLLWSSMVGRVLRMPPMTFGL